MRRKSYGIHQVQCYESFLDMAFGLSIWPSTDRLVQFCCFVFVFVFSLLEDSCSVRKVFVTHAKDPSLIPGTHVKIWAWWGVLIILRLWRQGQADP